MRKIDKLPISDKLEKELQEKQQRIDVGQQKPDWKLSGEQRAAIKSLLSKAQKQLCCYCECHIDQDNLHIEHFYERHDYSSKIYDYNNMIISCNGDTFPVVRKESSIQRRERLENMSCGHKKTKSYHKNTEIDYALLLNPMQEISHLFSYFDGHIAPSRTCNDQETQKVAYSIKRLNLDSEKLDNRRINAIIEIEHQLLNLPPEEQTLFLQDLLNEAQLQLPAFYSTIKDNFSYLIHHTEHE